MKTSFNLLLTVPDEMKEGNQFNVGALYRNLKVYLLLRFELNFEPKKGCSLSGRNHNNMMCSRNVEPEGHGSSILTGVREGEANVQPFA